MYVICSINICLKHALYTLKLILNSFKNHCCSSIKCPISWMIKIDGRILLEIKADFLMHPVSKL